MSKYDGLGNFLRGQRLSKFPMTFAQIEQVTGTSLPPKAQHHRAWWSNNPGNNVMTKVWLEAGYRTEQVDIPHERLVFRRSAPEQRNLKEDGQMFEPAPKGKAFQVHPIVGALKGTFTIEPGWDLTKSALDEDDIDAAIEKTADLIDEGLRGGSR